MQNARARRQRGVFWPISLAIARLMVFQSVVVLSPWLAPNDLARWVAVAGSIVGDVAAALAANSSRLSP